MEEGAEYSFIAPQPVPGTAIRVTAPDGKEVYLPSENFIEGQRLYLAKDETEGSGWKVFLKEEDDDPLGVPSNELIAQQNLLHPPEAYFSQDVDQSIAFFRENGYLLIPNAIPLSLVQRCRAAVKASVDECSLAAMQHPDVTAALEKVWHIVRLFVKDPLLSGNAQVAMVPRMKHEGGIESLNWYPDDMHIDGIDEASGIIKNFSLLVGIPLDPSEESFTGNFGVVPGSHLLLQEGFRREGIEELKTANWHKAMKRHAITDSTTFEPLRVSVGQAYIAHYQTIHFIQPNIRGADIRHVLYFRIWNDRGDDFTTNEAALTDVFCEFFPPNDEASRQARTNEPVKRIIMRLKEYDNCVAAAPVGAA